MTEVRMTRPQIIPATTKITAAWKRNTDAIDGLSRVARAIVAVPAEAQLGQRLSPQLKTAIAKRPEN